jgi:hypothetical protein
MAKHTDAAINPNTGHTIRHASNSFAGKASKWLKPNARIDRPPAHPGDRTNNKSPTLTRASHHQRRTDPSKDTRSRPRITYQLNKTSRRPIDINLYNRS